MASIATIISGMATSSTAVAIHASTRPTAPTSMIRIFRQLDDADDPRLVPLVRKLPGERGEQEKGTVAAAVASALNHVSACGLL